MIQRPTYAITIRQPYVELILRGIKKVEHRSRPTDIRGRVYLYASTRPADSPLEWQKVAAYPGMLPTHVIVGTVEIVNCRRDEQRCCYVYDLRNPRRLARSLRPRNQPNPGFWCPKFSWQLVPPEKKNRMFEHFTDRARKVMALAHQEAQHFHHEYVGTEHILLGLVNEGSGVGATILKSLDVDIKKLRLEVEKVIETGPNAATMGQLPQTPGAKKVIEYAVEESRALNHSYVGTEHILLGLLREGEGIAAQVLMNLGLRLEEVRDELLRLLGTAEGQTPLSAGAAEPGVAGYKDLPAWQKADELAQQVYAVTGTFPQGQIPRVASRLRKMALAIPPRIAEAHSRRAPGEAKWLLNAAFASLQELRHLLDFARKRETLKAEDHQKLDGLAEELDKLLCALYGSLAAKDGVSSG